MTPDCPTSETIPEQTSDSAVGHANEDLTSGVNCHLFLIKTKETVNVSPFVDYPVE
jgi:hypothetical protein